jgi:hypothetical protein
VLTALGLTATLIGGSAGAPAMAQGGTAGRTAAAPPTNEWTLMYYGVADNNLEANMVADVKEMAQAGLGGKVALYALLDRSPDDNGDPSGEVVDGPLGELGDFSTAKVFRVDGSKLVEMKDLGEVNMASPKTLGWFVSQIMRIAPAKHTALIMSDHGAGGFAFGSDDDTDGKGAKASMTIRDVAAGLQAGLTPSGRKLDLIGFDACLMSNLETARWMVPFASLLLGSEDTIPGSGYDYRSLRKLTSDPKLDATGLGQAILDGYRSQYGTSDYAETSLALLDLKAIGRLDTSVATMSRALRSAHDDVGFLEDAAASEAAMTLDTSWGFVDLGDLARRLAQPGHPDAVRKAADAVFAAVGRAVIVQYRGLARQDATGMSITVPTSDEFADLQAADYATFAPKDWNAWLTDAFASTAGQATGGLWDAYVPKVESQQGGFVVSAPLEQAAVDQQGLVSVEGLFGVSTRDQGMAVLLRKPAVRDSGATGRVSSTWNRAFFQLVDAEGPIDSTTTLVLNSGAITAYIMGTYVGPDGSKAPAELDFSVDPATGTPSGLHGWLLDSSGAWGPLTPEAGSTFEPDLTTVTPDGTKLGRTSLGSVSFDGDGVGVQLRNYGADVGTGALGLLAVDAAGTPSTVFAFVSS